MPKAFFRIALAVCALSLGLFAAPASATPSNAFYLRNASGRTLHFMYGCEDGTMYSKTIPPHAGYYYWVRNGCTTYTIKKSTTSDDGETKSFTYTLTAGDRYELFWDSSKDAWNIEEL